MPADVPLLPRSSHRPGALRRAASRRSPHRRPGASGDRGSPGSPVPPAAPPSRSSRSSPGRPPPGSAGSTRPRSPPRSTSGTRSPSAGRPASCGRASSPRCGAWSSAWRSASSIGTVLGLVAGLSRVGEELVDAPLQMLRALPFLGPHAAADRLARHRRGREGRPRRDRGDLPGLPEPAQGDPRRRPALRGAVEGLRRRPLGRDPQGDPARRAALVPRRPALLARHRLALARDRRDGQRRQGHRLPDHAGPAVPADRRDRHGARRSTPCSAC